MNYLDIEGVSKHYSNHKALDNVSISVPLQSIFGLLGPNGAGKTTLIRIINNITAPDSGNVFLNGEKLKPEHTSIIGYLPEERGLYKKMKIGEQAVYLAQLKGLTQREAKRELKLWFEKFDLMTWWNRKVEELSKGMQQKVQFITTILHKPKLLIFDEPFSGFDPINANLLKEEIIKLRQNGATVLFSTHNMSSVEEICDHIALINKSKKILEGNVKQIKINHKTNTYIAELHSEKESLTPFLNSDFSIIEEWKEEAIIKCKIRPKDNLKPNDVLKKLFTLGEVMSFNEIIPSMNDIFIKQVKEDANTIIAN